MINYNIIGIIVQSPVQRLPSDNVLPLKVHQLNPFTFTGS